MNYIRVTDIENNVSFQFDNSKADGGLINSFEGFEDSVAINSIEDVASRIGATAVNSKSGRRLVTWSPVFVCDVLEKRRDMLAALRRTGFLKLIEFETPDGLELQFEAYFDKLKAPYSSALNKPMFIQFSAPDPRFYSQTEHTTTGSRNDTVVVDNVGTEVTNPTFRINGPFTEVVITNLNNSQEMTLTHTVLLGEYIEVNTLDQTITMDDGTPIYSAADGTPDFIIIEPGENTIQFSDTGGGVGTEIDVLWRDAYNGI